MHIKLKKITRSDKIEKILICKVLNKLLIIALVRNKKDKFFITCRTSAIDRMRTEYVYT